MARLTRPLPAIRKTPRRGPAKAQICVPLLADQGRKSLCISKVTAKLFIFLILAHGAAPPAAPVAQTRSLFAGRRTVPFAGFKTLPGNVAVSDADTGSPRRYRACGCQLTRYRSCCYSPVQRRLASQSTRLCLLPLLYRACCWPASCTVSPQYHRRNCGVQ